MDKFRVCATPACACIPTLCVQLGTFDLPAPVKYYFMIPAQNCENSLRSFNSMEFIRFCLNMCSEFRASTWIRMFYYKYIDLQFCVVFDTYKESPFKIIIGSGYGTHTFCSGASHRFGARWLQEFAKCVARPAEYNKVLNESTNTHTHTRF